MRSVLSDILDQRAKLRLTFDSRITSLRELSGALTGANASGLTVEISALKSASASWVGMSVSCYFRVRDRENPAFSHFYTFASRIESTQVAPNGLVLFTLSQPQTVEHAQQRRSVRVSADQNRIPALVVWRELSPGANVSGTPPLFRNEDRAQGKLRVDNISTCGLRLIVQNAALSEIGLKPTVGESYSFYFKTVEAQEDMEKTFLVNAVLRNLFYDPQAGETALGFEFTAEGALNKDKRLVWTPLRASEATGLNAFIFKWNLLDFYKEKRVDEGVLG
ncbi:MAG TPA: hypothetical protein VN419_09500 [Humidesulfovibrio sp.]|uniref:hypothetical protein n=1 Tax=Humidesulfovibrio sp. TaxID=2910988 RepID=UPI002BC2D209|nr:hypothetical protein [Humidesulfovibrio sp.]HWR04243.1 hypothetical protein [Humidesulfovibrio sp.]